MRAAVLPPNLLTYARVLLTPIIASALLAGDCPAALRWTIAAGLTDGADGFLARRFRWESRLGAYLDPIADKLLLVTLFICLGLRGVAPPWLVWLVVGRDALILVMAAIAFSFTRIREFPPSVWGKASTVLQIGAAAAILAGCATGVEGWRAASSVLVWTAGAATLWSGLHYVARGLRLWRTSVV